MTKGFGPVDVDNFYMTRNEIASRHNNKLELQAMTRVRDFVQKQRKAKAKAEAKTTEPKAQKAK